MKFFQQNIVPMTFNDTIAVARLLKYDYVPKGQPIRQALQKNSKLCYIMAGKVVCSFPQQEVLEERAKKEGITLAAGFGGTVVTAANTRAAGSVFESVDSLNPSNL